MLLLGCSQLRLLLLLGSFESRLLAVQRLAGLHTISNVAEGGGQYICTQPCYAYKLKVAAGGIM
jgi:hypothetical protein